MNDADAITPEPPHPLIATIDPKATYVGQLPGDGGRWADFPGNPAVPGRHVQASISRAARLGGSATLHDGAITITRPGTVPTRWIPAP